MVHLSNLIDWYWYTIINQVQTVLGFHRFFYLPLFFVSGPPRGPMLLCVSCLLRLLCSVTVCQAPLVFHDLDSFWRILERYLIKCASIRAFLMFPSCVDGFWKEDHTGKVLLSPHCTKRTTPSWLVAVVKVVWCLTLCHPGRHRMPMLASWMIFLGVPVKVFWEEISIWTGGLRKAGGPLHVGGLHPICSARTEQKGRGKVEFPHCLTA